MELQQQFEEAVAASKTLTQKPDNQFLLQLYALYKQAIEGDVTADGPANAFDFVAKFKHEARVKIKGTSKESAMQQYVALVNQLKAN
ncbi:MAG: acyl-CoA-binding protein [Chitinophagaceae bacterium]|nr:acyl-CoA-binding protein [Chitinophagaceae bacterium]